MENKETPQSIISSMEIELSTTTTAIEGVFVESIALWHLKIQAWKKSESSHEYLFLYYMNLSDWLYESNNMKTALLNKSRLVKAKTSSV